MNRGRCKQSQRGAVLLVALVLLLGVTVVSLSSLNTGLLEMIMAGNEEARIAAFQRAQAGIDAIATDPANFPVVGGIGDTNCTGNITGETCTETNLSFPNGFDGARHSAKTERLGPLLACPPRGFATSCDAFKVAHFSVDSRYDEIENRGGSARLFQGFMVLVPEASEETVISDGDITPP